MLKAIIDFLLNRKGYPSQDQTSVPYKVETPKVETPEVKPVVVESTTAPPDNKIAKQEATPSNTAEKPKVGKAAAMSAKSADAKKKPAAKKAPAKPRAKKATTTK